MDSDGQDVSVSQENVTETIGQAANRMYEEQLRQDETQNSQVVDSEFDDPDPLPVNANRDATRKFNKEVEDYSREMVEAFEVCKYFKGEILWEEYLRTFRRHTIEAMPNALVARWSHLLRMGGIQLESKRGVSRHKALIDVLEAEEFPQGTMDDGDHGDVELEDIQAVDENTTVKIKPEVPESTKPVTGPTSHVKPDPV